jgi:hypothetical protein
MSLKDLSANTAKSYISAVGFKCKITGCSDVTQNFIVHKVLEGMKRLKNRADTRLPITPDILQRIVSILPSICFNMHENKLFKVAFTLAYWGLFRVGEITLSNKKNINNILSNNDVHIVAIQNLGLQIIYSTSSNSCSKTLDNIQMINHFRFFVSLDFRIFHYKRGLAACKN